MIGINNYHLRLLKILIKDPFKFPSLWRLRTGGEHRRGAYYKRTDGFSGPPITVSIRPTYRCNLRCVQCGQWGIRGVFGPDGQMEIKNGELTSDEIRKFIQEVAPFRPYIYFTGGEPLLREDLFELVKFASSHHLLTSVSSNATMLSGKVDEILNSGLDYFYGSLDAPGELNDQIRKGENSFEKTVAGIRALIRQRDFQKRPGPIVQVQTIIVKENQNQLFEMAKFVDSELKPDVWGLQLCVFSTEQANQQTEKTYRAAFGIEAKFWKGFIMDYSQGLDFTLLNEELWKIRKQRWNFKLRLYSPLSSPGFSFEKYFLEPQKLIAQPPCLYPWAFAQLQPNGDIAFCGSQPDYIAGNIREESFEKIWNGERAKNFRLFIQKQQFASCPRCFGMFIFSNYK